MKRTLRENAGALALLYIDPEGNRPASSRRSRMRTVVYPAAFPGRTR
jgi:hypothetical protein